MKSKVVVDLDLCTVLEEGGTDVIELPGEIGNYLEEALKQEKMFYEEKLLSRNDSTFKSYLVGKTVTKEANKH